MSRRTSPKIDELPATKPETKKPAAGSRSGSREVKSVAPREPLTERGWNSRNKLCDAASEVFGQLGYHNASVSEIARRAGVAQGTFYVHFESKNAIFAELVRTLNRDMRARAREAVKDAPSILDAEERQIEAIFDLILERPELYRIVFESEFVDRQLSTEHYLKITDGWVRRLRSHFAETSEGHVPNAEAVAFCIFGIVTMVGMRWPYWTKKRIPKDVLSTVVQFVRDGLRPLLRSEGS